MTEGSGDGLGVNVRRGNELPPLIGVLGNSAMLRSAREAIHVAREVFKLGVSREARKILIHPDGGGAADHTRTHRKQTLPTAETWLKEREGGTRS